MGIDNPTPKEPAMYRYLSTLALAIAATLVTAQVKAETVLIYREGQIVNPQEVAEVLTRSIHLLDAGPAAPAKFTTVAAVKTSASQPASRPVARKDANADASALSLPVRFAFDSAEIQPAARPQLDALADGIKLLSPKSIVTVEGHTDAIGSEAYNLELSRARAVAVRDYLVQHHGIDPARLKTVGYGEDRPLEGSSPIAAVNRRVQFRAA
jgi:outer membrane protein OmpA-like peptidoglycan-associated protein